MRLRKADRELFAVIDQRIEDGDLFDEYDGRLRKAWSSFFSRVEADELKATKKAAGYPVRDAVKAIKGVLRGRCVVPISPGQQWFIALQNRINASGLTEELITKAAQQAAVEWRGRIRAESVIRQADDLLTKGGDEEHPSTETVEREYLEDL